MLRICLLKCQSQLHTKLKVNFFIENETSWCSGSSGQDSNNLSSEISCAKNHRWYLEANRGVPFQETCSSYFNDCVWPLHLCQTLVHSSCFCQESVWRILLTSAYLLFFYSQSNAILLCVYAVHDIVMFSLLLWHKNLFPSPYSQVFVKSTLEFWRYIRQCISCLRATREIDQWTVQGSRKKITIAIFS